MPAQQLIKVYADGTGDFTSLKTAIDTHVQNLITNDKALVFELSGTLSHSGSYIDFGSYTTDATRNITIKAKAGEEATGVAGAGTSFSSSTYIFVLRGEYVVIDGVELAGAGSGPALYASNNTTVKNALISADKTISDTAGASFENVVFFDCGEVNAPSGNGVYVRKANLHRCTLVASSTRGGYNGQIITRDADGVITQCLIINETTGGYDNYFQCTNVLNDYNADSEGNAPGSTTFTSSSSDVVDYAGENYNTKPSSSLYTAGPNGEPIGAVLVVSGGGTVISTTGIPTAESFGGLSVIVSGVSVSPTGITSEEVIGSHTVATAGISIQPNGIVSLEVVNSPTVLVGGVLLSPSGITTEEVVSNPSILTGSTILTPEGITSLEDFGNINLVFDQVVEVVSVESGEVFGTAIIQDGIALVIPADSRHTYQAMQEFLDGTGKFVSSQNNGILMEWLKSEGINGEQFNELFNNYWEGLGYTGAYNDKWKKWKDS
jgi:hypothetical protein